MPDSATAEAFDINAIGGDFLDDPYPTLAALREHDPVHRNPDGSYFLTRHADLLAVYKDSAMSSDKKVEFKPKFGDSPLFEHHTTSLPFSDPPSHTRVRKLVAAAFAPRALAALTPRIEAVVAQLLDRAHDAGELDIIEDFGIIVPTEVIGDMLGVPTEKRHLLRGWSMKILGALDPITPAEVLDAGNRAVAEFCAFLRELIKERQRRPDAGGRGEVLAALIFGETEGERLSERELLHNCIFILNAGHETTTSLIGHGVHILLSHPNELARLRAEPGLIETAVEEFLRYESPVQMGNRRTIENGEIGGVALPADTYLHLSIAAANRDPLEFANPDTVDITRAPNRHLAFGAGKHICLGLTLGRIEGQIAIGQLVNRFPKLRQIDSPSYFGRARFRGFNTYRVAV
jgi:cytochrome P450